METPVKPSPFAVALRGLLEVSERTTRQQWADWLGVTTEVIEKWLADEAIPRARTLWSLMRIFREWKDVSQEPLRRFAEMAERPARQVSPFGREMHPTVGCYITRPMRESFEETLATIPSHAQEQLLSEAIARVRELRNSAAAYDLFAESVPSVWEKIEQKSS